MKIEYSTDQLEKELLRMAFAFEMQQAPTLSAASRDTPYNQEFCTEGGGFDLSLNFGINGGFEGLWRIEVSEGARRYLQLEYDPDRNPQWGLLDYFTVGASALMARGLYRLDFEEGSIISQLPPLSAHEKMEMRLSLPKDFWPRKWIDAEAKMTT